MKNWRQVVLYLTIAGIEACWLYALLPIINDKGAGGQLSVFGILLLYPVAFFLNVLLLWAGWHRFFRAVILFIAWVPALLLSIKFQLFGSLPFSDPAWLRALPNALANIFNFFSPELWLIVTTGLVWWLGRRLAQTRITFTIAVAEFQFGLFFLLILFFSTSAFEVSLPNPVPLALIFFSLSLLGISIAHAEEGESWLARLRQGYWPALLVVTIIAVLLLGLLIGSLLTPDFLQIIVNAIVWFWNFLWGLFIKLMLFIASLFPPSEPLPGEPPNTTPPQDELGGFDPSELMPAWLRTAIRMGWSVLMIAVLVFAMWRIFSQIFRWLRRRFTDKSVVEYESMRGAFKADLLAFLKRLFYRLIGRRLRRAPKAEAPEVSSIRQIYRQLLGWAASQCHPRLAFQTPYEYLYTLEALLPESKEPLGLITQSYVGARYGHYAPTDAELGELKATWHQLKHLSL